MAQLNTIIEEIEAVTNTSLTQHRLSGVGGGCINTAYQLQTDEQDFFIKLNSPSLAYMFEAEDYDLPASSIHGMGIVIWCWNIFLWGVYVVTPRQH